MYEPSRDSISLNLRWLIHRPRDPRLEYPYPVPVPGPRLASVISYIISINVEAMHTPLQHTRPVDMDSVRGYID